MSKAKKSGKGAGRRRNRTPLKGHIQSGKQLRTPFSNSGLPWRFSSWVNERLPEMLWAVLIRARRDQKDAINEFRRILHFVHELEEPKELSDLTLTGLALVNDELRSRFLRHITVDERSALALTPLRLFDDLPARDSWLEVIPDVEPDASLLMDAVGQTLWHQSDEATDCRWVRLMGLVLSGKMKFVGNSISSARDWLSYPNEGELGLVRSSIRAAEINFPGSHVDTTWATAFWGQAWKRTPCFRLIETRQWEVPVDAIVTRRRIDEVLKSLKQHWAETHTTTAIDPRHDGVFGLAFYSLRLMEELIAIGNGTGVIGRIALRGLLEVRLNLRYLLKRNDDELWKTWRKYGAGQAKLNALRFEDGTAPKHIDISSLEYISNEDLWEEFVDIELGQWAKVDLRRMAMEVGLKDLYDRHYSWTSAYIHGSWGAVRESCFQVCGNPLHRLHRFPEDAHLRDTVGEAADLVDQVLAEVDAAYPRFSWRIVNPMAPDDLTGN